MPWKRWKISNWRQSYRTHNYLLNNTFDFHRKIKAEKSLHRIVLIRTMKFVWWWVCSQMSISNRFRMCKWGHMTGFVDVDSVLLSIHLHFSLKSRDKDLFDEHLLWLLFRCNYWNMNSFELQIATGFKCLFQHTVQGGYLLTMLCAYA